MGNVLFVVRVSVVLCVMGTLAGAASGADKAAEIARATYPGENDQGKCKVYADALFKALKAGHIQAWEIYFLVGSGLESYQHAMVVYHDAGAYWYVDNLFPFPTKSWGKTTREWIQDRCNAVDDPPGPVNIFSEPVIYFGILKVKSTDRGYSSGRIAAKPAVRKKNVALAQAGNSY